MPTFQVFARIPGTDRYAHAAVTAADAEAAANIAGAQVQAGQVGMVVVDEAAASYYQAQRVSTVQVVASDSGTVTG